MMFTRHKSRLTQDEALYFYNWPVRALFLSYEWPIILLSAQGKTIDWPRRVIHYFFSEVDSSDLENNQEKQH